MNKPTIHELEKTLDEHSGKVEILPDGSVVVDAELTKLRAECTRLRTALDTTHGYIENLQASLHGAQCKPEDKRELESLLTQAEHCTAEALKDAQEAEDGRK